VFAECGVRYDVAEVNQQLDENELLERLSGSTGFSLETTNS